ncbi:uncharacterized protein LOC125671374 [Ostrea edulis]|uniref:uncharacterized protein LOC125671374 n=1 Tax=Ostrea edulis TaxID=37623 RepID=UPI0024AF8A2D|nr:uncharacterized protein LOC125671374 [Ostrea edulis]
MLRFRYLTVLLLICLLTIDHTESWRRRRFRRFTSRIGRAVRRVRMRRVGTAISVIRTLGILAGAGKRSAENVLPNLDVCRFDTLDLNDDNEISQEELSVLIQMSGLEELDDLFANLDKDKNDVVTREEYDDELGSDVCKEENEKTDEEEQNEMTGDLQDNGSAKSEDV